MMKFITSIFRWLAGLFDQRYYTIERSEELPKVLKPKVLYLLGDKSDPWVASMLCPCGCEEKILLSLLPMDKPSWEVNHDKYGKTSLQPSVWRTKGCRSHFFFTRNEIHWCD